MAVIKVYVLRIRELSREFQEGSNAALVVADLSIFQRGVPAYFIGRVTKNYGG